MMNVKNPEVLPTDMFKPAL